MRLDRLLFAAGIYVCAALNPIVTRAQAVDSAALGSAACDGSIRAARTRRDHAENLSRAGLGASIASAALLLTSARPDPRVPPHRTRFELASSLFLAGQLAHLSGVVLYARSGTPAGAWDDALQRLTIGEATAADVEKCLGEPVVRTMHVVNRPADVSADSGTSWEYRWRSRQSLFGKSTLHIVTITFRDSVVSHIKVTESR